MNTLLSALAILAGLGAIIVIVIVWLSRIGKNQNWRP